MIFRRAFFSSSQAAIQRLKRHGLIQHTTFPLDTGPILPLNASIYAGFDPTAKSLHVGNLLALISLLHFGIEGCQMVALVGGATGRVGDPSWRSKEKDRLADEAIQANVQSIQEQIALFFERAPAFVVSLRPIKSPPPVKIVNNYEWYKDMSILSFLDRVGSRTRLASLLSRECIRSRAQSDHGLSFSELTYQLLQAYDFYHLHQQHSCRLQIGGSDQWGNIVSGLDLISRLTTSSAHGLTLPLLTTGSACEKMGKSAGNAVWLDPELTSPFHLYQYFADLSDTDAANLLPRLSFRPSEQIAELINKHALNPDKRLVQRQLSYDVTALVHTEDAAMRVERASEILFGNHNRAVDGKDLETLFSVLRGSSLVQRFKPVELLGAKIADTLSALTDSSKNAIRNIIKSGGVSFNGSTKLTDIHATFGPEHFVSDRILLRTGKQSFFLLCLE